MAWKPTAPFTGAGGQLAVVGELLSRGCNAAIPAIDVGMDVFAFRDGKHDVARIQVKTARAEKRRRGLYARFSLPVRQLDEADDPELFYVLAVRLQEEWACFLVIGRAALQGLAAEGMGAVNPSSRTLDLGLNLTPSAAGGDGRSWDVACGPADLTRYVGAWETLPPLDPAAPANSEVPPDLLPRPGSPQA